MGSCSLWESFRQERMHRDLPDHWWLRTTLPSCLGLGSPHLLSFPAMLRNAQRMLSSLSGDSTCTSPSQTRPLPFWMLHHGGHVSTGPRGSGITEGLPGADGSAGNGSGPQWPQCTVLRLPTTPRDSNTPLCPKATLSFI